MATERLRHAAVESDVQEIALGDECFDNRADQFIQDYETQQRGRTVASGVTPGRPTRSSSPRANSMNGGRSLDGQSLQAIVEKQFATAQQVLAAQHEQSLQVIRHYCGLQEHQAFLPGSVSGASLPMAVESLSERAPTSLGTTSGSLSVGTTSGSLSPSSKGKNNPHPGRPVLLLHSKPDDGIKQREKVTETTDMVEFVEFERDATPDPDKPDNSDKLDANKRVNSRCRNSMTSNRRLSRHNKAQTAAERARQLAQEAKEDGADKPSGGPKSVFADAADMKAKVKEAIMKPEYNVANFYKKTGIWQSVARSAPFDNFTLGVIALNAIWIAIDTDHNDAETLLAADPIFQIGENAFCIYFSGELFIRFMAFKRKQDGFRDAWFVFDSALVLMMVVETWILNLVFYLASGGASGGGLGNASILRLVRLLRLTRMARMVRLLRAMPELMILIKGMAVATRSVFFTLCLLLIIIYIFAIAFTQLSVDTSLEDSHFSSVHKSMSSLLLQGTLPDLAEFVETVADEGWYYSVLLLIFILLSTLTVMNMLVGVLCEVINVVSSVEKEQMTVQFVKTKLLAMLEYSGIDQDGNKRISKSEFEELLLMPEGARIIQEVGVDVVGLVDFADHIFKDDIELSFPDFMELVLQLRDNNVATVRDIVNLRKLITNMTQDQARGIVDDINKDMKKRFQEVNSILVTANIASSNASITKIAQPSIEYAWSQDSQLSGQSVPPALHRSLSPQVEQPRPQTGASFASSRPQTGQAKQVQFQDDPELEQTATRSRPRPVSGNVRPASGHSRPASGNVRARSPVVKPAPPAFPSNMWLAEYDDVP